MSNKTSQALIDVTAKRADLFLACAFELVCKDVPKPTDYAMAWAMKPDRLGATLTMTAGPFTASEWIGAVQKERAKNYEEQTDVRTTPRPKPCAA